MLVEMMRYESREKLLASNIQNAFTQVSIIYQVCRASKIVRIYTLPIYTTLKMRQEGASYYPEGNTDWKHRPIFT